MGETKETKKRRKHKKHKKRDYSDSPESLSDSLYEEDKKIQKRRRSRSTYQKPPRRE